MCSIQVISLEILLGFQHTLLQEGSLKPRNSEWVWRINCVDWAARHTMKVKVRVHYRYNKDIEDDDIL